MFLNKQFVGILAILFSFSCTVGALTKIHFPLSTSTYFPRLRLQDTLPVLREFTFCTWLRPFDSRNYSTILSYATTRSHNELLILLYNESNMMMLYFYRNTHQKIDCYDRWDIGVWKHLCVTWFGPTGSTKAYVGGNLCEKKTSTFKEPVIPSGGIVIIGQDQDELDSKFDESQSWYGDMTYINLWDKILSKSELKDARMGDENGIVKKGNVFSWGESPMAVFDGAIFS